MAETFHSKYFAILNRILTDLKAITGVTKVFLGAKTRTLAQADFPAVFLIPALVNLPDITIRGGIYASANFNMIIVKRYQKMELEETDFDDFVTVCDSVLDKFKEDRTLGGNAKILKFVSFEPDIQEGPGYFDLFSRLIISAEFFWQGG